MPAIPLRSAVANFFFFQAEDGIRDLTVTGVQTCALPISTVVVLAPQQQQKPLDPPPVQLADALKGFQTVAVPTQIPTDIPPVDLQQRFDPKDYSGNGIDGGRANGIVVSGSEVYAEALVEERPELLSAPPPIYPQLLRQAGIQGPVMLHAIVDTTGRVEPASVRVIQNPSPPLDPTTQGR